MKFVTALVLLAIVLMPLGGCATRLFDPATDEIPEVTGRAWTVPDAPPAAVGAVWNASSTSWPYYYTQVVDPWNWNHMVWRSFHTVWSTVLFVPALLVEEIPPGPDGPIEFYDQLFPPVRETVSFDFSPAPHGGGDGLGYWGSRSDAWVQHFTNAWSTLKYSFLNSNSYYPPYDRWYPEQLQGEKTTIHKVLDVHFFRYDWDNPYIN